MFLLIFVTTKEELINYDKVTSCSYCDDMGSYDIIYTYLVLTVFFLPVWKWNKQYIAERTCCKKRFVLDYNVGEALRRGENVEIIDAMMPRAERKSGNKTPALSNNTSSFVRRAPSVTAETTEPTYDS